MRLAASTIGMSAYNVIAKTGAPANVRAVFNVLKTNLDPTLTADEVTEVFSELMGRGLIRVVSEADGTVDVLDPRRRVVRWRDRTGDGWTGWQVDDVTGPKKIDGETTWHS